MTQTPTTKPKPPQMKPATLRTFHQALMDWYKTHGRHDLPWRNTSDAYEIWVSEVMLQQTQVVTVRDRFYGPFLAKFPSVEALAAAPESEVMKMWEGLGYYSRARNLHAAAKHVAISNWWVHTARDGNLPPLSTHASLLTSLPGIGRNTAHAILAFAYHQPVAILEANVKRVVARVFALTHPSDQQLWDSAHVLLDVAHPFDYNQAMMDVGSAVCTPKNPHCSECPAAALCEGKKSPENYPAAKAKKSIPTRYVTIEVREDGAGKLYLEQRSNKLLGGLWGFPQTLYPPTVTTYDSLGKVTHVYSHFRLEGDVVHIKSSKNITEENWFSRAQIAALALSKLDHKVLALVEKHHSAAKNASKSKTPRLKR